ncbi:MAG: hypothetical protein HZB36_01535 [Candidatus Omnitrophica bacterium]|nr:hypothetical protein [Candidatus Omnitrophota bacterium]
MNVLFFAAVIFVFAFCLHVFIWKVRLPRRQTDALLLIFGSVFIFGLAVPRSFIPPCMALISFTEYLRCGLFYAAVVLAYVISYSALEADSPTLLITLKIAQAGALGLLKEDLFRSLGDDRLLLPRLEDLIRDGLAVSENGNYILTGKGALFVKIFILFRKILGAQKGG